MNQYTCYVCKYWTWAETLPDEFVDENTHKSCAENLQKWEAYHRPLAEKIAQDIAAARKSIHECFGIPNGVD